MVLVSCSTKNNSGGTNFRQDFNKREDTLLKTGREIIKNAYFAQFASVNKEGMPKIRVIEPFAPDKEWNVFFGTNPRSRKVKEIKNHPQSALHYFDKARLAYVSLYGKAYIENDSLLRKKYWKESWKSFYPDKEKDFMLIRFVPEKMELIHLTKGFSGDSLTWKPHEIILRD